VRPAHVVSCEATTSKEPLNPHFFSHTYFVAAGATTGTYGAAAFFIASICPPSLLLSLLLPLPLLPLLLPLPLPLPLLPDRVLPF
jgi:hypothetical protein